MTYLVSSPHCTKIADEGAHSFGMLYSVGARNCLLDKVNDEGKCMSFFYDVFVSYRWAEPDQSWVRDELVPALEASKLKVCLDVQDFVPGRDLILEMSRAGTQSRRAICVLSPAYFDGNRMVGFESLMARRFDPSGNESRLIPFVLRKCEIPEWLYGLVPVDWTAPSYHKREWHKLLRVLGAPEIGAKIPGLAIERQIPAPVPEQKSWCWWSTHESIQNEVPSVTAIFETMIAVLLYWWIALQVGVLWPLLVSAAVAPMVLLRSDQSVALGIKWFRLYSDHRRASRARSLTSVEKIILVVLALFFSLKALVSISNAIGLILFSLAGRYKQYESLVPSWFFNIDRLILAPSYIGFAFVLFLVGAPGIYLLLLATTIRISASLRYLSAGIAALPRNFRRLVLCTSPAQVPEFVPGLNTTSSPHTFKKAMDIPKVIDESQLAYGKWYSGLAVSYVYLSLFIMFVPAWLYRITIKSTAWFWWPLAFLGDDLKIAQNPDLLHFKVMGRLWAKASIAIATLSLLTFAFAQLYILAFGKDGIIAPVEWLLLIDWKKLWSWQICGLLGSVLTLAIVFMVDDAGGEYRIAQTTSDSKLLGAAKAKCGWIERLIRIRFLVFLAFWGLLGAHMVLYVNSTQCWFSLPSTLQEWAQSIYGDLYPRSKCSAP
jgi:hypothetical protein